MALIISIIQQSPEVLVFLALGIGYFIGKIKIKGFGIGTTASVLLVALALGQFTIQVPDLLKNISFALFAFSIGYQVGPQFFGAMRKEGLNYLWISAIIAFSGLAIAIILGKLMHFDRGTTAGLFAGAMTQSAAIGTAQGAVDHLAVSDAAKAAINSNIAISYAITYVFGVVGVIIFFKMLPGFLRLNIKAEAKKLEEKMGGASDISKSPEFFSWSQQVSLRAHEVTNNAIAGKSVGEIERLFLPVRVSIDKIKRQEKLFESSQDTVIESKDILIMAGKHIGLANARDLIGREVDISAVTNIIGEALNVCVLNPAFTGKSIAELAKSPYAHGLFLTGISRQGHNLPILPDTVINKCDIVNIIGARGHVEKAAKMLGYPQRYTPVTDLVMLGIGCVLGTLLGLIVVPIAGIPITLGVGGGVLVGGLIFGWLRSIHPTFGQMPDAAQWLLNDFGLSLFVACVGLGSGKQAIQAMQTNGVPIFLCGIALALVPIIIGVIFGRYVLRMNPVLLLGALTGARVIPQALNTLQEDAESSTLALGFAAPFAFANVFLTIMGSVIINIM